MNIELGEKPHSLLALLPASVSPRQRAWPVRERVSSSTAVARTALSAHEPTSGRLSPRRRSSSPWATYRPPTA